MRFLAILNIQQIINAFHSTTTKINTIAKLIGFILGRLKCTQHMYYTFATYKNIHIKHYIEIEFSLQMLFDVVRRRKKLQR